MREIVHIQAGQCGNQIGTSVRLKLTSNDGITKDYTYSKCSHLIT